MPKAVRCKDGLGIACKPRWCFHRNKRVFDGHQSTDVLRIIKSMRAREILKRCPQVKKKLWGGEFCTDGYFASTVGKHGDEGKIGKYVKNQGNEYQQLHSEPQLGLF